MNKSITIRQTQQLQGETTPPSSKSQCIRGLFFALLSRGESSLSNFLDSQDTHHALESCKLLGMRLKTDLNDNDINKDKNNSVYNLDIISQGVPLQTKAENIYTGNSGITTRFILPILGLRKNFTQPVMVSCGEQMQQRPMQSFIETLKKLGLNIHYPEKLHYLPITVSGRLEGGQASVDGLSSQYLSALLISLPCAENESEITVRHLQERPYIEMTLSWLDQQNIIYSHKKREDTDIFTIPGKQVYQGFNQSISGDFSSASCIIAAGACLKSRIVLHGMNMTDKQGDKKIVSLLQQMGADIQIQNNMFIIQGGRELTGMEIDANDVPDLLPALAVIGTQARGKTVIKNVKQARIKETDRIHSMTQGLKLLGAAVTEHPDGMTIYPGNLKGAHIEGYGDHRTVMALSVAGLLAEGQTIVNDSDAISKTFPDFVDVMRSLGADMIIDD